MSDLLDMAAAFFTERNWPHASIDQPRAIEVSHDWASVPFKSRAQAKGGGPIFLYYSLCPERVPAARRAAVADYLTRVNSGLLVGGFEMDWDDGEVRFRTSVDLQDQAMTDALMGGLVYPNHQAMIDYLPHLLAVIHGELEPAEGYREARESLG